ncbi:phage portal protein [Bradyrhizobium zhanjiangense]|uniref:Phage portal protein n=1 Tax=Bradyrhizobium zhanjiangense TaxID=1325107 RepID=A0A4Q0SRN9_9BRAD|nr:phage portal protein [Bradyrhizobium zhanjiangense]RXH41069.1 hypothetical protein XH94_09505 [Bradyrhizobium zhanjiangense]
MKRPGIIRRSINRLLGRNFDAAGGSGRWPRSAALWAQNSASLAARKVMNPRISYLAHNSPAGASVVESWTNALCGDGPAVRSAHPDPEVRQRLEDSFAEWSLHAAIEGDGFDLSGMLETLTRSVVQAGEGLVHFVIDDGAQLRLRLLNPDQLDSSKTVPSLGMTGDGPNIVSGVEFNERGRRVGYWVLPDPPDAPWASVALPERVDAADIAHCFVRKFPGQVRGISWLAPIATRLLELDQLEDAALMKAKVAALQTYFLTDANDVSGMFKPDEIEGFDPATVEVYPGSVTALPPGVGITAPLVGDMVQIAEVMRHMLRSIASGCGLTYERISSDLSQTNYSSARLGEGVFQRKVKAAQSSLLVAQFLLPVWRRFVMLEILSGRVSAPDFEANPLAYLNAKFLFPGMPPIDPLKQAKADALDLASRTKSRAEIVASNGRDISDVDSELEDDPFYVSDPAQAQALLNQPEEVANA